MERGSPPSLLPILRSEHQARILTAILVDPTKETSLTDLGTRLEIPVPTVHREIERAEAAAIVVSRRVGNTRLVSANTESPYHEGLSDILAKAFGPPRVLAEALGPVGGIETAHIFGSWATRYVDSHSAGPVSDVDLLVLGEPDRDALYAAVSGAEVRLGRPVQVTIRSPNWLTEGTGSFHATVTRRALVEVPLTR